MEKAKALFDKNIHRVQALVDIARRIESENREISEDILRAAIVLLVSALDTFIHDVVRIGMVQILRGERNQTQEYQKFAVTMNLISFDGSYRWFEEEIRRRHSKLSFQTPKDIVDILKLIIKEDIWASMAAYLQENSEQLKKKLNAIVSKRNKIAHESDIDPTSNGESYNPVDSPAELEKHIEFIKTLVFHLYKVLTQSINAN